MLTHKYGEMDRRRPIEKVPMQFIIAFLAGIRFSLGTFIRSHHFQSCYCPLQCNGIKGQQSRVIFQNVA